MMELNYDNNNSEIRRQRYLSEYKTALTSFREAQTLMAEWTPQIDTLVYDKCSLTSEKLFSAIEHLLKELMTRKEEELSQHINLMMLCKKLKDEEELKGIETSVFITRKEPRNQLTHSGRLTELIEYERVLQNLRNLITNIYPEIILEEIEMDKNHFKSEIFFCDIEEFKSNDCHYMLLIDPVNDISDGLMMKFLSVNWNIIVDFDGRTEDGKIYRNISKKMDTQLFELPNIKNQGLAEKLFRLKRTIILHVNPGKVAPNRIKEWSKKDKSNLEYFFSKSCIIEKQKIKVVVARPSDAVTELVLNKIVDAYGNDSVELFFVSENFTEDKEKELSERYDNVLSYNNNSLYRAISSISDRIIDYYGDIVELDLPDGVFVGNKGGATLIQDRNLIDNLSAYFEILDMSKGKEADETTDEESFLLGKNTSWEVFNLKYDVIPIEKRAYDDYLNLLRSALGTVENESKIFTLVHKAGFGGTTLSRRIAWDMHFEYPVVILTSYELMNTIQILQDFYSICKRGVLVVVDENNVPKTHIEHIINDVRNAKFPIALLSVSRESNGARRNKKTQKNKMSLYYIEKNAKDALIQKCKTLAVKKFDGNLVMEREELLNSIEAKEQCPLIIGLFFLEKEFKGTDDYVRHFLSSLGADEESLKVKKALKIIAMCDYFGQKKIYKAVIDKIINPTNIKGVNTLDYLNKVDGLLVIDNKNNYNSIKTRHYLISKELMKQSFPDQNGSQNWKDYIAQNSEDLIELLIEVSKYKVDSEMIYFVKELFIENRDSYLKGKVSLLLEKCASDEERLRVFNNLVNRFDLHINELDIIEEDKLIIYQYLAHLWAHLSRLYSSKGTINNWEKASQCSNKALEYASQVDLRDPILYHIAGDSMAKKINFTLDKLVDKVETLEYLKVNGDDIEAVERHFQAAIDYGNIEYGLTGKVNFWTKLIMKVLSLCELSNVFDIDKIEKKFLKEGYKKEALLIQQGITTLVEIFEYTNLVEFDEVASNIINTNKDNFVSKLYSKDNSEVLMNLNNHLNNLLSHKIKDTYRIENTKRLIIRTILYKYRDNVGYSYSKFEQHNDKKAQQDYVTLMTYLEENINSEFIKNEWSFKLWFNLFRYGDISKDDVIIMARRWYDFTIEKNTPNPLPVYYLYVMHILRSIDGYTNSLEEGMKYQRECNRIYEKMRGDNILIDYRKTRDWMIKEESVVKLLKDSDIQYSEMLKNKSLMHVKGKFIEIDPANRRVYGFLEITEPIEIRGIRVFFRPIDAGVTERQINHIFEFIMGFSYERFVAFDKSLCDITVPYAKKNQSNSIKSIGLSKEVVIGDQIHFTVEKYLQKNKLLVGKIIENSKQGRIHISKIHKENFVTDEEMFKYEGAARITAYVIGYDKDRDVYNLSLIAEEIEKKDRNEGSMAKAMTDVFKNQSKKSH